MNLAVRYRITIPSDPQTQRKQYVHMYAASILSLKAAHRQCGQKFGGLCLSFK